jgi:hypothetical protein
MTILFQKLQSYFEQNHNVRSVIYVDNQNEFSPLTDGFEVLLLIVCHSYDEQRPLSHYIQQNKRIQERWVDEKQLRNWIAAGENRRIVEWLIRGTILLDRDRFCTDLVKNLHEFPSDLREQRLLVEFSAFLRTYLQSKQYLRSGHYMDAFTNILEALHHWARISIIEQGLHPEVTVWEQLKSINIGIYKLYEELILSPDPIEKRIQLLILASEFFASTKIEICCSILLRILRSRNEPWTVQELYQHVEMRALPVDLNLILHKLMKKSLVTVTEREASHSDFKEMLYTV